MVTLSDHEMVLVDGRPYLARGYMNRISAPVGTILGPNSLGEYLVVVEEDVLMDRVRLAHCRPDDFARLPDYPRSVTEYKLRRNNR